MVYNNNINVNVNPLKRSLIHLFWYNMLVGAVTYVSIVWYDLFDEFLQDPNNIVSIILYYMVFVIFIYLEHAYSLYKKYENRDDIVKNFSDDKNISKLELEVLNYEMSKHEGWFTFLNSLFVYLGLFGTLYGIGIAVFMLADISFDDSGAIKNAMMIFLGNISTAFNTSIVGIIGLIWNSINLNIIRHATRDYIMDMMLYGLAKKEKEKDQNKLLLG